MPRLLTLLFCSVLVLSACSGSETVVRKNWAPTDRTIVIVDITPRDDGYVEAGAHMLSAIEDNITETLFVLDREKPKFSLKFRVMHYHEGSRIGRFASMGMSKNSRSELKIKAALYHENSMLGAWEVTTWIKGGVTGGSEDSLYTQAAKEIINHLKGSNY